MTIKTILLILFMCLVHNAKSTIYYFSSFTGDDNRTAAEAQNPATPWRTLTKFNSFFSSLLPGDVVLFKRGETFYGSLNISRSGTSAQPITIGGYDNGSKPIITGFQNVTSWTAIGSGIYENNCTTCAATVNMVSFQDTLQALGRWPKHTAPASGYLTLQSHSGTTVINSNAIGSALNYAGGEVVIRKYGWILDRGKINSQTSSSVNYSPLTSPSHPGFTYEPRDGYGFFFQNHVRTLTQLGEWMYESATKKLRMYFGSSAPSSYSIKASIIEDLVTINSRSFIIFDNITFKGSNASTFKIINSSRIEIKNCTIDLSGIDGVTVSDSRSNNITISNCTISNSNSNAITANASPSWVIKNNLITRTGLHRGMGMSGDGQYIAISNLGSNSLAEFNEIKNTGYIGISFHGDNILIKNNFIDSFALVKSDAGGIYTSAETTKTNRRIIGNIILNGIGDRNGRGADAMNNPYAGNIHGIYLDQGAASVDINDNTVANCAQSGLEISSCVDINASNNTFFNNTVTQIFYLDYLRPLSRLNLKRNILFATKQEQLIAVVNTGSNNMSTWGSIDSNYYCRPIKEPQGIVTSGYPNAPTLVDYPGGGIIQGADYKFYSLDRWKTLSGQDANTIKTPVTDIDLNSTLFIYNATNSSSSIPLNGTYANVKNQLYNNTITLLPYTSAVLLKKTGTGGSCSATGTVLREQWTRVNGTAVTDIPLQSAPSSSSQISKLETQNTGEEMGARIRGYICAPLSGNYTFYIAGDDGVELWLSTTASPSNKVKIAGYIGWTSFQQWDRYPTQKSVPINLQAGQSYYIEILHKNGYGGDHLSVKWDLPNGTTEAPISGNRLSPFTVAPPPPIGSASISGNIQETQVLKQTSLSVFPNPVQNVTNIQVNAVENGEATLTLFDVHGVPVKQIFRGRLETAQPRSFRLSSESLARGTYIIRLVTKSKTINQKIIFIK